MIDRLPAHMKMLDTDTHEDYVGPILGFILSSIAEEIAAASCHCTCSCTPRPEGLNHSA
jgi:hypothetical protein